jgi:hypothetical protein
MRKFHGYSSFDTTVNGNTKLAVVPALSLSACGHDSSFAAVVATSVEHDENHGHDR